jgi:hypothetical protein
MRQLFNVGAMCCYRNMLDWKAGMSKALWSLGRMRRTRGTQPTSAWRTTNVVARSAIIMVDHIQSSELAQASQQLSRSLGLADGDDLPFLISSSTRQKPGGRFHLLGRQPAHAQNDHFSRVLAPFERTARVDHHGLSTLSGPLLRSSQRNPLPLLTTPR